MEVQLHLQAAQFIKKLYTLCYSMLYVRDWARVWCLFGPAILLLVCIKRLCSSIRSLVSHIIVIQDTLTPYVKLTQSKAPQMDK